MSKEFGRRALFSLLLGAPAGAVAGFAAAPPVEVTGADFEEFKRQSEAKDRDLEEKNMMTNERVNTASKAVINVDRRLKVVEKLIHG